jgi:hypothetical protein
MYGWPLHLLVVTFADDALPSHVADQLRSSRERGVIRVLDGGMLIKGDEGDIEFRVLPDLLLDDSALPGRLVSALFGLDPETGQFGEEAVATEETRAFGLSADDLAEIIDGIPRASIALVLLVEHLWIAGFAESADDDRGILLAQGWVTPATFSDACRASRSEIL